MQEDGAPIVLFSHRDESQMRRESRHGKTFDSTGRSWLSIISSGDQLTAAVGSSQPH